MPKAKARLSKRQEKFCLEYLKDLNATQAAIRAGYSKNGANVTAHNLMANPHVSHRIEQANQSRLKRVEIDGDKILERLDYIGDVDIAGFYDEKGWFKNIHDIPPELRKCIKSIEIFEEWNGVGQDRTKVGEVRKVTYWDKIKANELLGKHKKLWIDRVEISDNTERAERLKKARERVKNRP